MKCSKCGEEVPADAIYCPRCTGERETSDAEVKLGGVKGGTIGLAIGLAIVTVILNYYDLERGIKAIVLIVPVATFTTGLIIGLVKAKREWK
ncbi:MAG: zinc ribbon domain-containing protein [Azonexus sp.]|nr:zinc ribbon domain-containing protein [Azonexus sp.]MDZ4314495.1 zinc ribbon domain-containing protein [Azonexus sp.]